MNWPHVHVQDELDALVSGALSAARASRVKGHVARCGRCREQLELVRAGREALGALTVAPLPPDEWARVARAVAHANARTESERAELTPRVSWTERRGLLLGAVAATIVVVTLGVFAILRTNQGRPVAALNGTPRVEGREVAAGSRLLLGGWLETDASSRARISFGPLGHVDVEPGSRLRLVASSPLEQRLDLQRGRLNAIVTAPPRLFVVDTPAARAVDLGCAYELIVEESGDGLLDVAAGRVALGGGADEVVVEAGETCRMWRGRGASVPCRRGSSEAFREAVDAAARGEEAALPGVIAGATAGDARTLLWLVPRHEPGGRDGLVRRAADLAAPPSGVTLDGVIALDREMLDNWIQSI